MIKEDRALEQNAPRTRHLVFTASGHTDLFRLPGRKVVAQRDVQAEFNFHRLHQGRQHPCGWAPASAEQALHNRETTALQNLCHKDALGGR